MFFIDNLSCLSFYDQALPEQRNGFFSFIQIATKAMEWILHNATIQ